MRRHSVSRPPFWAPEIFRANRQTQQIRHRQICWKLACTPPQRRRRRNPGRTMTLLAKPPLSVGQCPATQRNLQLPWKSGEEEIKFRRLMWLRKEAWISETNARPPLRRSYSRVALPARRRRTFQPNLNLTNQNWTSKTSGNRKEHSIATQNGSPGGGIVQVAQQSILPSASICLNWKWPSNHFGCTRNFEAKNCLIFEAVFGFAQ